MANETFFAGRELTREGEEIPVLTNIPQRASGLQRREAITLPRREPTSLPAPGDIYRQQEEDYQHAQTMIGHITKEGTRRGYTPEAIREAIGLRGFDKVPRPVAPKVVEAKREQPFTKVDPSKYTPKSVRSFQQTGDFGSLIPREKPITARERAATIKLTQAEVKQSKAKADELSKAGIISDKAAKALDQVGFFTTGFTGKMLSYVPGTTAFDLDKTVDTIKANVGFEELRAMKAASPTGGALGQVTVREIEFLQSALEALEIGQSEDQLTEGLTNVKIHYDNIIRNIEEGKKAGNSTFGDIENIQETDTNQISGPSQEDLEFTAQKHGITVDEVKRRLGVR